MKPAVRATMRSYRGHMSNKDIIVTGERLTGREQLVLALVALGVDCRDDRSRLSRGRCDG